MAVNHEVSYCDSIQSNIIVDNKGKIYSYVVERKGASFLKLFFVNIKLPANSYVEFQYGENSIQREFFHNTEKVAIIIPDERVNIRVVLTKAVNSDDVFSFELSSVEYENTEVFSSFFNARYICHDGTEIGDNALAAGSMIGMEPWVNCSLIGSENHLLTHAKTLYDDPDLQHTEIWLNYFHQSCKGDSPINEPVRLKAGKILEMSNGIGGNQPYALLTIDEFDYENSNVKELFGGLKISEETPAVNDRIYIPEHRTSMYIIDRQSVDMHAYVERTGDVVSFSAWISPQSIGSPVISLENNEIIALHTGTHFHDFIYWGPSGKKLLSELDSFIDDSNESVIGLGNVTSFNLELTIFDTLGRLIPINLDKKGVILPFDTVAITDYDSYSLIEVEAIDLITDEVFPLTFKASLVDGDYQTNIHDNNITGEVFLKIYGFDLELDRLVKFWLTFKVSDPINNIRNYVIRAVLDYYDPHDSVFNMSADVDSVEVLNLNIWKNDQLRKSSVSYTIEGIDTYGFVAFYNGQGPVDLIHGEYGYSEVKVFLKNASNDEVLVYLRGERQTACTTRTMNSSVGCGDPHKFSRLVLSFHPEDNEHLKYHQSGLYIGVIPLQARRWGSNTGFEDIQVNVILRDLILDSEPENINPS
ncbi:hypothetical protein [Klebsiella sp. BIGb0407]|uniref:hypothetical protein n=1 Tax=Klebsiella sp. BIGb0407 TaxID=2940603 RepID=UPI00216708B6|nr:hypothetical protein [Klebsiella sp. BIGb0407]MCS3433299.1 hypothetical protein [Klebsiella sp. BIGb0407]